jgi:hypothetical protein
MIWLSNGTRTMAVAQLVVGMVVLAGSAIYHREVFREYGALGYLIGGGLVIVGIWAWFSVQHREKFVEEAKAKARRTAADFATEGIPDTAASSADFLPVIALMLVVFGVITFPLGVLFLAGAGVLWWHARKQKAARVAQGEARFFPRKPDPVIGGMLHGEIRLPAGMPPPGPGGLTLACRRHVLVDGSKNSTRLDTESLGETVQRQVATEDWKMTDQGTVAVIALPIRGGAPTQGPVPPVELEKPSVGWYLTLALPHRKYEFVIPVGGSAAPEHPEIPPELAAAAGDILGQGNPERVAAFLAEKSVEARSVAAVAPQDVGAVLAAGGIKEVPKANAVGGHGLQMDPAASSAAQNFMNAGVGCVIIICIGLGLMSLFLIAVPYVGWLLALAALAAVAWFLRGALRDKAKIAREPELLWVEPGHLCYMPDGATEYRVPQTEIARLEIQWIGSSGDRKYVKLSAAGPTQGGGSQRERTLLAHGIGGVETARAVTVWLLQRLQAELPVVEAQQGQDQLEKMNDWVNDPTKR